MIARSGKLDQLIFNQAIENINFENYKQSLDIKDFDISLIGVNLFFGGLFIYVIFKTLTKVSLEPSGDPLFKESEKFVY